MSNPHLYSAETDLALLLPTQLTIPERIAIAQLKATMAVAFEARTANLIAALSAGFLLGHEHEDEAWADEIMPRLDLGDTK